MGAAAVGEYDVKAAFLLNFARFVHWPATSFPEPDTAIALCVMRENPFGDTLERLVQGELVGGRRVEVRRIWTPDESPLCHVLFVPGPVFAEDGGVVVPRDVGLLTVGESEGFLTEGGIVSFYTENGRVRFAIDPDAAARSGLRMSARLLRVARLVRGREGSSR